MTTFLVACWIFTGLCLLSTAFNVGRIVVWNKQIRRTREEIRRLDAETQRLRAR